TGYNNGTTSDLNSYRWHILVAGSVIFASVSFFMSDSGKKLFFCFPPPKKKHTSIDEYAELIFWINKSFLSSSAYYSTNTNKK
ncbi:hypothetical protein N9733_07275, partial [Akkermansiaceae bacterium]|nr:hypothetical protein [Akkermansiaceae bacterium]